MSPRTARTIDELKPPHSPRSEVVTINRWVSSAPVPASSLGAFSAPATLSAMAPTIRSMRSA